MGYWGWGRFDFVFRFRTHFRTRAVAAGVFLANVKLTTSLRTFCFPGGKNLAVLAAPTPFRSGRFVRSGRFHRLRKFFSTMFFCFFTGFKEMSPAFAAF
jgi:hypothetical protein